MLFSIIMPVYNSKTFLAESIQSVIEQKYKDWELVIVNDGSTDCSEDIIMSFANHDSRIKYYYKENGGVSSARNLGLTSSSGEYILFLDADDKLHVDCLINVSNIVNKYNCDIVVYNTRRNDFDSKEVMPFTKPFDKSVLFLDTEELKKEYIYNALSSDVSFGIIGNYVVKRNVVKDIKFRLDMILCEDLVFDIEMYKKAVSVVCLPDYYYFYRDNALGCVRRFNQQKLLDLKKVYEVKMKLIEEYDLYDNKDKLLKWVCSSIIYFYWDVINNKKASKEYLFCVLNDAVIMGWFNQIKAQKLPKGFPSIKFIVGNVFERFLYRKLFLFKKFVKKIILR